MQEFIVDGIPVLGNANEKRPRLIRIRAKKPGKKPKKRVERPAKLSSRERNELSLRQRKALKNYFSGDMSKQEAGIAAGYAPGSAVPAINTALTTPAGQRVMEKALKKAGVDEDTIADVIKDGLSAKHPFKPEQADWHARHKFVQEATKILDGYPATKVKQEGEHKVLHVHLTAEDAKAFNKYQRMREGDENC